MYDEISKNESHVEQPENASIPKWPHFYQKRETLSPHIQPVICPWFGEGNSKISKKKFHQKKTSNFIPQKPQRIYTIKNTILLHLNNSTQIRPNPSHYLLHQPNTDHHLPNIHNRRGHFLLKAASITDFISHGEQMWPHTSTARISICVCVNGSRHLLQSSQLPSIAGSLHSSECSAYTSVVKINVKTWR